MARTRNTARISTGGRAPKYAKRVREAREQEYEDLPYTWVYILVRFIDIRGRMKTDLAGNLRANTVIELCDTPDALSDTFGIDVEPHTNIHVLVGVQARRYHCDRLDAYLLVGFRMEDTFIYTDEMVDMIKDRFIRENVPFDLGEHINIMYDNNEDTVRVCQSIIKDMEDTAEIGSIDNVIF